MSEVIYRKYRPKTFDQVVGQRAVKLTLQNEVLSGNIAHAYLFVGPRGTGKTTLARLFARSLNCKNRKKDSAEPCNVCDICQMILNGRSMDVIEIDAASHTGVDNVRENIIASAQVPAFNPQGYKVFIIDEVHMLSKSAFNALLKTLEEPPRNVIFILATTEIYKVPETIISRCQRFDLKKLTQVEIVKRLGEILEWEKVSMPENILPEIARKAQGSLRDAQSILEQIISLSGGKVTEELAALVLPRSNWQEVDTLVQALRLKNLSAALNQINKLVTEGIDLRGFIDDLLDYLRQIMLYSIIGPSYQLDMAESYVQSVKKHSSEFSVSELSHLINIILAKSTIRDTLIDQLPLELACVEYLHKFEHVPESVEDFPHAAVTKSTLKNNTTASGLELKSLWPKMVAEAKAHNHSLAALLQTAHPIDITANKIIIGVEFAFHVDQLSKANMKSKIAEVIDEITGQKMVIEIAVDPNYRDNHQDFRGKGEKGVEEALDTFGGEML